jgi:hypothetical protein
MYLVFDINRNVTIGNETKDFFGLILEAWENDSIQFKTAIEDDLETILGNQGVDLEWFTMDLNQTQKQIAIYYIVSDIITNQVVTIHNETRIFNPTTFLVEVIARNSTLTLNNTYECDLSWIRNGPQGQVVYNLSENSVDYEYTFEFNEIFDYSPLASINMNNWSQTTNVFYYSYNYSGGTSPQFLYASLTVFPEARGVYAQGDILYYTVPEGLSQPYFGVLLIVGGVLVIAGIAVSILFQPTKSPQQPIQKKWMKKRKRKRKR